jgi:hypothetical protein
MKQTTKRKIAREIVILFSCAVLIGLIWTIFWTVNKVHRSNVEQFQIEISNLTHYIDSIQTTFSKSEYFGKMLDVKNVPTEYFNKGRLPIVIFPEIIWGESSIQQSSFINERWLFLLLQKLNPPFDIDSIDSFAFYGEFGFKVNPFSKLKEPIPFDTLKSISENFETDFPQRDELKRYYDFLKTKKCIIVGFKEFSFTMYGLPMPPSEDVLIVYEKSKMEFEEASKDLNKTKFKIRSADEMKEIAKWISIIVLSLVYPFRFLFLLLKWAIKTLRQNAT